MTNTDLFKDPFEDIVVPPKEPKPKRTFKKKNVAKFVDAGGTVVVWYDVKHGDLCFKRAGRSKTSRMSLRDIYDKVIGQMPLALKDQDEPVKLVFKFK